MLTLTRPDTPYEPWRESCGPDPGSRNPAPRRFDRPRPTRSKMQGAPCPPFHGESRFGVLQLLPRSQNAPRCWPDLLRRQFRRTGTSLSRHKPGPVLIESRLPWEVQSLTSLLLLLRFLGYTIKDYFWRGRFERCRNAFDIAAHARLKPQLANVHSSGRIRRRLKNVVVIMVQRKRQFIEGRLETIPVGLDGDHTVTRVFVATDVVFQLMRRMCVLLALGELFRVFLVLSGFLLRLKLLEPFSKVHWF